MSIKFFIFDSFICHSWSHRPRHFAYWFIHNQTSTSRFICVDFLFFFLFPSKSIHPICTVTLCNEHIPFSLNNKKKTTHTIIYSQVNDCFFVNSTKRNGDSTETEYWQLNWSSLKVTDSMRSRCSYFFSLSFSFSCVSYLKYINIFLHAHMAVRDAMHVYTLYTFLCSLWKEIQYRMR